MGGFSLTVPRRDGGAAQAVSDRDGREGHVVDAAEARGGRARVVHPRRQRRDDHRRGGRRWAGRHQFPIVVLPAVDEFLTAVAEETGLHLRPGFTDLEGAIAKLGSIAGIVGATLRDTANPTMLKAGKANVIPATAEAVIDCRVIPGRQAAFEREVDEIIGPGCHPRVGHRIALVRNGIRRRTGGRDERRAAGRRPRVAYLVPYMLSGGTDAKHFARLGIWCFGFIPLRLPPELDFAALFHGSTSGTHRRTGVRRPGARAF